MQLEVAELDLRHAALRIADRARTQRLVASLCEAGQQTPVLVVRDVDGRFILIDGYARVEALRKLAHDMVEAAVLEMPEAETLIVGYRLDNARQRSALEEGWLLQELREGHGLELDELAKKLDRSKSWVSRRLALVRVLPPSVQSAVQRGNVSAQVATKYLVPLARANAEHCERLVERLGDTRLSVREAERVWAAWRKAEPQHRERIVEEPKLFLQADAAARVPKDTPQCGAIEAVIGDLGAVAGLCMRARNRLDERDVASPGEGQRRALSRAFVRAREAFGSLSARLEEEG